MTNNLVQRIWGVFDPVLGILKGVTTSGEFPYYSVLAGLQVVANYAAAREVLSTGNTAIIALGAITPADGSGGTYAYISTDHTSGCWFIGTCSGTVLTVSSVFNGTMAVGQSVNRSDTGATFGVVSSFGTGSGGTGTYNLSGAGASIPNAQIMTADSPPNILVGFDGGRWYLSVPFTPALAASLVPSANLTFNLGAPSFQWLNAYVQNLIGQSATLSGTLQTANLNVTGFVFSSLVPTLPNTYALASATNSWSQLYLGPNNTPVYNAATGNVGYFGITPAETAAGVTPVNYAYAPGVIERYGVTTTSTASTNVTAVNNALLSNKEVYSFYGWENIYPVSAVLVVPAGVRLRDCAFIGTQNLAAYAPFGADWQGQLICLTGTGSACRQVFVNGANYYCGGVVAAAIANPEVVDCWIENTGASPNSAAQGILVISCTGVNVQGNYVYNTLDGIQHATCTGGVIANNRVNITGQAGIWGTSSVGLSITGNAISNCGDVGLDMESGINCVTCGNQVASANNGELSWFSGSSGQSPSNCLFTANVCLRTPTYLAMVAGVPTATACNSSGALFIESVYAGSGGQNGIVFLGNEFYNTHSTSYAFLVNAVSASAVTSGITVESNYFFSTASIHYVQQCWDLVVKGNVFYGNGSTAAGADNLYKNPANGVWSKNFYYFDTARSANAALHYYTDSTLVAGGVGPIISDNEFYNCGQYAMIHDPYQTGTGATLSGNKLYIPTSLSLVAAWPANGGLTCTANGYPIYAGQDLYLGASGTATAVIDFATTTPLMGSCFVGSGELIVTAGSSQGASYAVVATPGAIYSRDGSGSASGLPASTSRYATFATPSVTATGPASTATYMNVRLTLQS